jgi:hypothetical protein
MQTAGADLFNPKKQESGSKPVDQSKQIYGPLRLVEPHEIEVNKDLTYSSRGEKHQRADFLPGMLNRNFSGKYWLKFRAGFPIEVVEYKL